VSEPLAEPAGAVQPAHQDRLAGRGPWTRRDVLAAVLVGVVVVAVVGVFRSAIVPTDPWRYVFYARAFPFEGAAPLGYTRYGMVLPLLPLVAVFGDAEVVFYVWPLLGAGMLAASVYLVGVRFWGRLTAVLAVVLALASPITFLNLSRGYPDVQSTGLLALAVVLALVARDQHRRGQARVLLLLAVGFLLGWAFEARETTVLLWPVIALVLWRRGQVLRHAAWVVAAMALWAVADVVISWVAYGNPLLRVEAFLRQDLATGTLPADNQARATYVGRSRWFYLGAIPRLLWTSAPGGAWTLVVMVVGALGVLSRRAGTRFVALCFLLAYLGFVAITGFVSPDHPSGRIDLQRYWVSFLPFAGLAAAGSVTDVADALTPGGHGRRSRKLRLAFALLGAAGPLVTLGVYVATAPQLVVNGATQLSQLRDHLASSTDGPVRIHTDSYTRRLLPTYRRGPFGGEDLWTGTIPLLGGPSPPRPGDLVALRSPTDPTCAACAAAVARWYAEGGSVPPTWTEVWAAQGRELVLYRVAGRSG
jgi:hypothetical protein